MDRPLRFISKASVFATPFIGWSMFLTGLSSFPNRGRIERECLGHILLNRDDTISKIRCLKDSLQLLKRGISVIYFPEGTRSENGGLRPFKKGAFTIAAQASVPIIPLTIFGSGIVPSFSVSGIVFRQSYGERKRIFIQRWNGVGKSAS